MINQNWICGKLKIFYHEIQNWNCPVLKICYNEK
jgi:hypothetical protein